MTDVIYSPQLISIAVVEKRDGERSGHGDGAQYLIRQRPSGAPLAGMWEFPGGKTLPGESAEAAAVRECREESGLVVRVMEELAVVDHGYAHGMLRLTFFRCACDDADAPPAGGFGWVDGAVLGDYEFPPANAAVLRMIAENARR